MSGDRTPLGHITRFIDVLRVAGVRISAAEALDAALAVKVLPWQSRSAIKAGLGAVLVKRAADRQTFGAVFDAYFELLGVMADPRRAAALGNADGPPGADGEDLGALGDWVLGDVDGEAARLGAVAEFLAGGDAGGLVGAIEAASQAIGLDAAVSPLQQGLMSYRLADALGIDAAVMQVLALFVARASGDGRATGTAPPWIQEAVNQRARTLRELSRAVTRAALRTRRPAVQRALAIAGLADRPFAQMSETELRVLESHVETLGKRLAGRLAMARRTPRPRQLDLHRTMRRSLSTGGVPMTIVWRRRPPTRPRLIVLCDVSDSVRNAARFMLTLAHAMAARFDRVASFAFVSELGDVSPLFATCEANEALRRIFAGEALNVFSSSNYGAVLEAFWERHEGLVTSRTTVLILGDGRTNDHPPRADLLARIASRARKVYWLNPENPALWGFGDSAMRDYVPIVEGAHCVANLVSLGTFIDALERVRRQ